MIHNHNSQTHPASKLIPPETVQGLLPPQRKIVKRRHRRKSRRFLARLLRITLTITEEEAA